MCKFFLSLPASSKNLLLNNDRSAGNEMYLCSAQVLLGGNKRDGQLFQPLTSQYLGARRRGYKTILLPENVDHENLD